MSVDSERVDCSDCETVVNELADERDRSPCPKCGSMRRTIHLQLSDTIDFPITEMLDMKVKKPSLPSDKKLRIHMKSGQELSFRLGRHVNKEWVMDRENDRYFELVIDPLTGDVLRHCDEPLSVHQGHGTAKFKAVPNEDADGK